MFDRESVLTWGVLQLELPSWSPFRRFKVSVSTVCLALATRLSPTSKENKWLAALLNQPQLRKRAKRNAIYNKLQCPGFWLLAFSHLLHLLHPLFLPPRPRPSKYPHTRLQSFVSSRGDASTTRQSDLLCIALELPLVAAKTGLDKISSHLLSFVSFFQSFFSLFVFCQKFL